MNSSEENDCCSNDEEDEGIREDNILHVEKQLPNSL